MPDPQDKMKRDGEAGQSAPQAEQRRDGGQPGGEIKDKEAETSDSYGDTRESGEEPK